MKRSSKAWSKKWKSNRKDQKNLKDRWKKLSKWSNTKSLVVEMELKMKKHKKRKSFSSCNFNKCKSKMRDCFKNLWNLNKKQSFFNKRNRRLKNKLNERKKKSKDRLVWFKWRMSRKILSSRGLRKLKERSLRQMNAPRWWRRTFLSVIN